MRIERSDGVNDNLPETERVHIELMRQAPAWRKLQVMDQMNQSLRLLAMSGLRSRYPSASEERLRRLLADLLLGPQLAKRVYGPLDEHAS